VVERTGGGLLVDVDDPASLADGLFSLWSDRDRLRGLGERAFAGVREHYTIQHSAARFLEILGAVTKAPEPAGASLA
jgi:glycosyltransferase involved in cell wall biosynthesis